jgi:phosphatidylserine synthase
MEPERLRKDGGGPITALVRQLLATLLAAAVSTAVFVVLRNRLDLEDSRFITTLLAFSTVALALSVASSISVRSPMRSTVALGVAAFLLVPLLYVVYLVVFVVSVCIVGGQTCYS